MLEYAPNSFMGLNYNSPTVQNMMNQKLHKNKGVG